jgi:arylsulfatase
VGIDTGTPVDDQDYQIPFRFTGKLHKVTINLKPVPLSEEDQKETSIKGRRQNASSE